MSDDGKVSGFNEPIRAAGHSDAAYMVTTATTAAEAFYFPYASLPHLTFFVVWIHFGRRQAGGSVSATGY